MTPEIIKSIVDGIMPALIDSFSEIEKRLAARIESLESRKLPEAIKGDPGDPGKDGRDGKDGQDGASVSIDDVERMVQGKVAEWALDFERRAQGVLERAVDRMPKPADGKDGRDGADGQDGLGFDDLKVEHDGERSFTLKFSRGEVCKEFKVALPVVIDRGVYKEGEVYAKGDATTWGGSLWIGQRDGLTEKPGSGDGWRLAVKKGRDGKDAK